MLKRVKNYIKGYMHTRKINNKKCNMHWRTELNTKTNFEGSNTTMPYVGLSYCNIVGYASKS